MVKILIMALFQDLKKIEEKIVESSAWEKMVEVMHWNYDINKDINISVLDVIILITAIFITSLILQLIYRIFTRKMPKNDERKFHVVYGYFRWLIFVIIFIVTLSSVGIDVTAIFAASAALLIGIGLALQTLFQDIISGVFILVDQSVHVGDVIEIDGEVGRVIEIKLRTTRAVTIENRILVIPNHLYLTNILHNWTQNDTITRENVVVGVAYGSDVELVKKLLLQAATNHKLVLEQPAPTALFTDFGDSSLNFKIVFTVENSFEAHLPKSDIRFDIDKLFRENNITIPFPQRDIHIIEKNQ